MTFLWPEKLRNGQKRSGTVMDVHGLYLKVNKLLVNFWVFKFLLNREHNYREHKLKYGKRKKVYSFFSKEPSKNAVRDRKFFIGVCRFSRKSIHMLCLSTIDSLSKALVIPWKDKMGRSLQQSIGFFNRSPWYFKFWN